MNVRYLLPCSCGAKVPVEPRQAGELIKCGCGTSLEIPTMMKMADLQRAEPQRAVGRTSRPWGIRQGLMLLGVVIMLLALVLGTFSLLRRPQPPVFDVPPEQIREYYQALSPLESWQRWRYLRTYGLDRTPLAIRKYYAEALLRWRLQMGVVLLLAAVGIALIAVPPLSKRRPKDGSR